MQYLKLMKWYSGYEQEKEEKLLQTHLNYIPSGIGEVEDVVH